MPQPDWEELERRVARLERLIAQGTLPAGAEQAEHLHAGADLLRPVPAGGGQALSVGHQPAIASRTAGFETLAGGGQALSVGHRPAIAGQTADSETLAGGGVSAGNGQQGNCPPVTAGAPLDPAAGSGPVLGGARWADAGAAGATAPTASPAVTPAINPTALLPVLGRALLGLAGAYLLRALTESATIPPPLGVAAGILYAVFWLFWAARTDAANRVDAALYSLTAVLVLCPLLWEATLHFHAISTWSAGSLLVLFVFFGLGVSWRKNLLAVATIVTLAGLGTAAGLLVATRDVVPFTLVFLATAAAVELSACLEHWLTERWLAALATDLAVLLATWLVTREQGLPEGYAAIPYGWLLGAQVALLGIYLASTIVRTLLRGFNFTLFETAQCAAAFLIGVGGGLRLSNEAHAIAVFALACAAACYVVSFAMLDRGGSHGRNFYTYSTFGIVLVLAGSRILLEGVTASAVWSALALACIWAGTFFGRLTLQVHGGIYLLLALAGTGALKHSTAFVLGTAHWPAESQAAVWAGLATAALCYLLAIRGPNAPANIQVFRLAVAGTLVWLLAGASAGALTSAYHAVFGAASSHPYCATLRTSVLAGLALLLAWAGARWHRVELSRLIYPTMVLGAYRLVMVDLGQDQKPALFLSLLVYGCALMALPHLARARPSAG